MISVKISLTSALVAACLLLFGAPGSTYNSYDEKRGNWEDNATWNGSNAPASYTNGDVFNIKGTVIINSDISTSSKIAINIESGDTLIVDANLNLQANDNSFIDIAVADNGVLIVLGSLSTGNNLDVATSGKVLILGDVTTGNGALVDNSGDMYVVGSQTPALPVTGDPIGGLDELLANEPDLISLIESQFPEYINKIKPILYAISNGNWSSTSVWSEDGTTPCGCIPSSTDEIIIDGYTVTLDIDAQITKLKLTNAASSASTSLILNTAKTLTVNNSVTIANNQTASEIVSIQANGTSVLDINGDLHFEGSADETAIVYLNESSMLDVAASITNNMYGNIHRSENATIVYSAFNDPNTIYGNTGNVAITYDNITISSGATYTVSGIAKIGGVLTLTNGYVVTDAANMLVLQDGATVAGGSDASFVDGPMRRIGSTSFIFPVGSNGVYAPIGIDLESATTSTYTAQYFASAPSDRDKRSGLDQLSAAEYWDIHKDAGVGAYVTLYFFDAERSGVLDPSKLVLAHWNSLDATWENKGMTASASNYIRSELMTSFSPVTTGGSEGALPVELTRFSAIIENSAVRLSWSTASETNNNYFTVERSIDGKTFVAIKTIDGRGTTSETTHYNVVDNNPDKGIVYYRLKQTDFDGSSSYSYVVSVSVPDAVKQIDAKIFPSVVQKGETVNVGIINGEFNNTSLSVSVIDSKGKMLQYECFVAAKGHNSYVLNLNNTIDPGLYFVRLKSGDVLYTQRLIIKE